MKAPAFQWYPKDCDTDENVRLMNDEEFGVYVRCLNHAWLNDGLPSDTRDLRRLFGGRGPEDDDETTEERRANDGQTTRKKRDRFNRIWKTVSKCFSLDESTGRLRNPKQEEQRTEQQEFKSSRKRAAESRWNAHAMQKQCKSNAHAFEMQCSASASASATAINTYTSPDSQVDPPETTTAPRETVNPADDPLARFERVFRGEWIADTWRTFGMTINTPEKLQALERNTPLWMQTRKYREGFGFNSTKFLTSGIWLKAPTPELMGDTRAAKAPHDAPARMTPDEREAERLRKKREVFAKYGEAMQ